MATNVAKYLKYVLFMQLDGWEEDKPVGIKMRSPRDLLRQLRLQKCFPINRAKVDDKKIETTNAVQ
jgi:hypothetical protein